MKYSFSGHQTFPFRYAWLAKGVDLAERDPQAFLRDHGVVKLGVGKNMVASIRFWCEALGLIQLDGRSGRGDASKLGVGVFGPDGWDPYLEDCGTLWFLQWQLAKVATPASSWFLLFTKWNHPVFSRLELAAWLLKRAVEDGNSRVSSASIKRDVDVLIRTYLPSTTEGRRAPEDTFDCPLAELGLLAQVDTNLYALQRGMQPTLPLEVLALAVTEYWDTHSAGQETLSFEALMFSPGAPGGAFQLSEAGLTERLERMPLWTGLRYDESAGMRKLVRTRKKRKLTPIDFLASYYRESSAGAPR
jgi:hypothetical protein